MNQFEIENMKLSPKSTHRKGPKRLMKFCLLCIVLPICILCIPLYMRFLALRPHSLTLSPTDMKLLNQESRVSTTWCQAQTIRMNSSFNAYLLHERPKLQRKKRRIHLERRMILEDDTKEYWGFYLLSGSKVTVSSCARFPGGNIIVVKGTKDANRCAWLGELDSEEESDEVSNEFLDVDEIERQQMLENIQNETSAPDSGGKQVEIKTGGSIPRSETENMSSKEVSKFIMQNSKGLSHDTIMKIIGHFGHMLKKPKNSSVEQNPTRDPPGTVVKTRRKRDLGEGAFKGMAGTKESLRNILNKKVSSDNKEEKLDGGEEYDDVANEDDFELHKLDLNGDQMVDHFREIGKFNQHNGLNMKTDRSNEEVRSSWSSSEEMLKRCEGLIHQYEYTGNPLCDIHLNNSDMGAAMDLFSLNITRTGFYYFIFSNENEITDNFLAANFDLQKTTFNVTDRHGECFNTTQCDLPLTFWTNEQIVIEASDVEENSECDTEGFTNYKQCHFVVRAESVCKPRGIVYFSFLILVPIFMLLFAYV